MTGVPDIQGLVRTPASVESSGSVSAPARRWVTRALLPAAIFIAVFGLVAYSAWDVIAPATPVRVLPVVVKATAVAAPGSVTVQAPGWIEPDPHPHFVAALTDGVIESVLVLEGESVEAGQVVAKLVGEDAVLARERAAARLDARRGDVAMAEAEVTAADAQIEHLVDRKEAVELACAEIAAVAAEREQAEAEISAAAARADALADEFERKSRLVASEAVARGEVERLRLRLAAERAAHDAKRARLPVLDARESAAVAKREAAELHVELLIEERRDLQLARARLAVSRAAERDAVAALAEADLRLARIEVRAEVSSIVLERRVAPGSIVQRMSETHSAHVIHLYDPARLQVRVDIPLVDAARVGVDQRAEVVVDALPDRVFRGRISRLVHVADIAKNTVEVKVAIVDPDPVLKPEMIARVRFLGAAEPTADVAERQRVFVPSAGLRGTRESGERIAFVVTAIRGDRGRVEERVVTCGAIEIDGYVEVESGLRPGDRVVVDAPAGLAVGARVAMKGER